MRGPWAASSFPRQHHGPVPMNEHTAGESQTLKARACSQKDESKAEQSHTKNAEEKSIQRDLTAMGGAPLISFQKRPS